MTASLKPIGIAVGGLLVVGLLVVGVWAWAPERSRAILNEKYQRPSTRFLEVSGATLRVRDIGSKAAPVLVFLHGFGSSLETWESWATALAADYRILYFDFPGCGLSPPDPAGDYTDARTIEIVTSLLDRLGVDKAVFVGNSMGGRIAWKIAAERPARVTKLVLISPDGFANPGFEYGKQPRVPRVLALMRFFLPRAVLRANLAVAYADPNRLSDSVLDRYYDFLLAAGNRDAMLERMKQTVLVDPLPLLRSITAPTLVLWGQKDAMIPYRNSADYMRVLPHATLVSFADLGHVPHEESPDESMIPMRQFLLH